MATQAESQDTIAGIVDKFATMFENNSGYSDADTSVVNDQSNDDWHNNGRVFQHSGTGIYILFFITYSNFSNRQGIAFHISESWNDTYGTPEDRTDISNTNSPPYNEATNNGVSIKRSSDSFTDNDGTDKGLWVFNGDYLGNSRSDFAQNFSATWFASVTQDHVTIGSWNTTSGNNGASACYTFQNSNKLWDDGTSNVALYHICNHTGNEHFSSTYCWNYNLNEDNWQDGTAQLNNYECAITNAMYGQINPASQDDTVFLRQPVVHDSASVEIPIAIYDPLIPVDRNEGPSHGDEIDIPDGTTYRIMRQSGASQSRTITVGMRYQ